MMNYFAFFVVFIFSSAGFLSAENMSLNSALGIIKTVLNQSGGSDLQNSNAYQEVEVYLKQCAQATDDAQVSDKDIKKFFLAAIKKEYWRSSIASLEQKLDDIIFRFFIIKNLQRKHELGDVDSAKKEIKSAQSTSYSAHNKPAFSQWKKNIEEMIKGFKVNPRSSTMQRMRMENLHRSRRAHNLSQEMLMGEIKEAINTFTAQLSRDHAWLDEVTPSLDFFSDKSLQKDFFEPYVQKLVVPEGSKVGIHGDLHGDIESLNACIDHWINEGYIEKDTFIIRDPHFYILFLGDYTDRGLYGPEVIYAILRLKNANPEKVFMVRGNHEQKWMNDSYGFSQQLAENFDDADKVYQEIYRWYNFLPLAIYLGSGDKNNKDFVQCCHGGIEMEYDPTPLLNEDDGIEYAKIGDDIGTANGFMWSDFIVLGKDKTFEQSPRGEGLFQFGKKTTDHFLSAWSTPENRLCSFFRAHQHADLKMLSLIYLDDYNADLSPFGELVGSDLDKGVAKLWISPEIYDHKNNPGNLTDIRAVTFCASPASGNLPPVDYASLLTIGKKYEDWKLNPKKLHK